MTLALAHSHAAPAFNGLFFATAATIIPVFFLALTLQGNIYRRLLQRARTTADDARQAYRASTTLPRGSSSRQAVMYHANSGCVTGTFKLLGAILLALYAIFIVLAGAAGELAALLDLSAQHAMPGDQSGVLAATGFLAVAVAAPAVLLLLRYFVTSVWVQAALIGTSVRAFSPRVDALLRQLSRSTSVTWPPAEDAGNLEDDYLPD